ncbi:MAG: hypothetical protein M1826_004518 [Phylliscum demangeonii]|nr:MAG: hypothetical protein M1826_004518 [Phylliscum demangeonii]
MPPPDPEDTFVPRLGFDYRHEVHFDPAALDRDGASVVFLNRLAAATKPGLVCHRRVGLKRCERCARLGGGCVHVPPKYQPQLVQFQSYLDPPLRSVLPPLSPGERRWPSTAQEESTPTWEIHSWAHASGAPEAAPDRAQEMRVGLGLRRSLARFGIMWLPDHLIPDDRINHLYTPGITPGTLFEGQLLRLDFQKFTSGNDDQKKYIVHVQTNLRKKKKKREWHCTKSDSVAVAHVPADGSWTVDQIREITSSPMTESTTCTRPASRRGPSSSLFEGQLLRLDFQKFTSGKDDQKKYNVHVQTNLRKKKKKREWHCTKSDSVAVAHVPADGSWAVDQIREELIASINAVTRKK